MAQQGLSPGEVQTQNVPSIHPEQSQPLPRYLGPDHSLTGVSPCGEPPPSHGGRPGLGVAHAGERWLPV